MEKNLTTGSVGRQLIGFSLPYLLSYLLQTLYGMADLFIIGQYEGVAGTTAVAVGSQVMHMLTVMIVGLAMGTTVSIARAIGADDRPQAAAATGNTVTLFLSLSLVLTVGLLLLRRPITAVGIVEKIIGFLFLVPSSMLSAVSALGAQDLGAGKPERAKQTLFWAIGLACGFGAVTVVAVQFLAEALVGLFNFRLVTGKARLPLRDGCYENLLGGSITVKDGQCDAPVEPVILRVTDQHTENRPFKEHE